MITQYKGFQYFSDRAPNKGVKYLVVHAFALPMNEMIAACQKLKVGPHYLIDVKGKIIQLIPEDKVAWHAGKSSWYLEEGLNSSSIGIELQNMSLGQTTYPKAQISAFEKLAKSIIKRHHIAPYNVVGHSDIAPTRKVDPNICFPWKELAPKGIGLWPTQDKTSTTRLSNKSLLQKIGYDITDEKAALYAFMRHFMPEYVPIDLDIGHAEENLTNHIQKNVLKNKLLREKLATVSALYESNRKE